MVRKPEDAARIRYIKLGSGGDWWRECRDLGRIRLGFATGLPEIYAAASEGRWDDIHSYWSSRCGTPTQHTNQTQEFFEDKGGTLWITFEDGHLFYTYSNGTPPTRIPDQRDCYREAGSDGWRNTDVQGKPLRIDQLSSRLTKTASYRMTICGLKPDVEEYLRRKLGARENPAVLRYEATKIELLKEVEELIRSLTWQDFEVLIELIFAQSGLRRVSRTGGTKKTTDIDLENIVTGETAFVQVKSLTSNRELLDYIGRKNAELGHINRMYYVYHTGNVTLQAEDVVVWNCKKVAEQVLLAGLVDWVVTKSK